MKNLQMSAKVYVEYKKEDLREGPEFRCSVCRQWFKKLLYWKDRKFHAEQEYRMIFFCGPACSTEDYDRNNK